MGIPEYYHRYYIINADASVFDTLFTELDDSACAHKKMLNKAIEMGIIRKPGNYIVCCPEFAPGTGERHFLNAKLFEVKMTGLKIV